MPRQPAPKQDSAQDRAANSLPGWVEPELATLTHDKFSDPGWIYERKFDGERCLAYADGAQVRLMTRNRQQVNSTYPELDEALGAQRATGFIVDGEVVAFVGRTTSFAQLQQRLGVRHPDAELRRRVPVYYYLFDVMYANGRDVRQLPLRDRKRILRDLLTFTGPLRFTTHRNRDGEAYWAKACQNGWEGLIAKRADAPYQAGRGRDWLKFKCENSQEFVIGGYTDPQGSRHGLGALLIGYYDDKGQLTYAGKVGTGFDEATLASLRRTLAGLERGRPPFARGSLPRSGVHWVEPKLVGQVGFSEWTTAGQLRHPRYQGLRRDKDPASVTREKPQQGAKP
jgi:bifunctional non-homologous end joining protein LigD